MELGQISKRRRPEIRFERARRELPLSLLRMDVAAFVGFAASGPLHRPVSVESEADFENVFGGPAPLAHDPETGRRVSANLHGSVRAFFGNGGRRCWIIRVADMDSADTQRFQLPGLVAADLEGTAENAFAPAVAIARSPGHWADGLRVSAVLERLALPLATDALVRTDDDWQILLRESSTRDLTPGDLVRLTLATDEDLVDCYAALDAPPTAVDGRFPVVIAAGTRLWLKRVDETAPVLRVGLVSREGKTVWRATASSDDRGVVFDLPDEVPLPQVGAALPVLFQDGASGALLVDSAARPDPQERAERIRISTHDVWRRIDEPQNTLRLLRLERLRFSLGVEDQEDRRWRLDHLGLAAGHPRYWRDLPDDSTLYPDPAAPQSKDRSSNREESAPDVETPRFPLAGDGLMPSAADLYLPLGMVLQPKAAHGLAAIGDVSAETRLRRDGLEDVSADLFLDPVLAARPAHALEAAGSDKRYIDGCSLRGLHGILPLGEVTLLAVPDIGHRSWRRRSRATQPDPRLEAPIIESLEPDADGGRLTWQPVERARAYLIETACDPAFALDREQRTVEAKQVEGPGSQEVASLHLPAEGCPRIYWARIRAVGELPRSPWSGTVAARLPEAEFTPKDEARLAAPAFEPLASGAEAQSQFWLRWSAVEGASRYRVEEASEPLFKAPAAAEVAGDAHLVTHAVDRIFFYRSRAELVEDAATAQIGPWSETLVVRPSASVAQPTLQISGAVTKAEADPEIVAVHAAMLRLGLARGDVFSLLSLPRASAAAAAQAHRAALTTALGADAADALSYGALYLPWLITRETAAVYETLPPEGAMAGSYARLALRHGAWVAPARQPLARVVAIEDRADGHDSSILFEVQVNAIVPYSDGFHASTADTLSSSPELRPVNVRRLLMLLQRLASREGARLMFEPNDTSFRQSLQLQLDGLMRDLHVRGAFAGAKPSEAYQVVADESVNTPRSVEAGQLIVELRVAPARPMEFLTIRLMQDVQRNLLAVRA